MKKLIKYLLAVLLLILILDLENNIYAQPATQHKKLKELSKFFSQRLKKRRPQLYYDLLKSKDLPQRKLNEDLDIELMYINERGYPVYYITDNLNAARTISTDDIWPGGSGGFSLSGAETVLGELGVWDAGGVRTTHQEFTGRVTQMDTPSATHYHSTHVAGTMVAKGVVLSAKGMSFEGTLAAYDWNNDESETALAASAGMNVSNHSYAYISGWYWYGYWYWYGDINISSSEDYNFGFYGSEVQAWDEIAYNAPYYTIVKSASNDRNDYGPGAGGGHYVWQNGQWTWSTDTREVDGGSDGYDSIPAGGSTAKNIITVGAVSDIPGGYTKPSDVVMSFFSSWGPTDDGRIKPDLTANGISLYSCDNDDDADYYTLSGTSMSAPNLAGSLNLLIRYYETNHGNVTPLSSTMKAVLIQTADEAGVNVGPDYMYGWGLMNTLKAAELIEADSQEAGRIIEDYLDNGETSEYFFYSDGSQPVRITLAWTDPAGTPPSASLNPRIAMLVNDLDLRVEGVETSTIFQPFVLDVYNPNNAAATGDNTRDNIEQVYIASVSSGTYRVTVSHKGQLGNTQYYSLASSNELKKPVCGAVYDGSGGPFTTETPYFVSCDAQVPSGEILTIAAGARIYFSSGSKITANGTLNVNAELDKPVYLISEAAPYRGMKLMTKLKLQNAGVLKPGE